jgi:hypothetical protein
MHWQHNSIYSSPFMQRATREQSASAGIPSRARQSRFFFCNKCLQILTEQAATAAESSSAQSHRHPSSHHQFPAHLAAQRLHFGNKHGFALYLPILSLQLLDQGHAVTLLLIPLLFQIFLR